MAVYRTIHISFWQDPFVLKLTPEEKYFYIYLMTNSKTNQIGCYEISKTIIKMETGYNEETVDKLIDRFIDYGKINYSNDTDEMLLINWHKYSWSKSPKVETCIVGEWQSVKNQGFKTILHRLCIDYGYSMDSLWIKEEEKETKEKTKTYKKTKEKVTYVPDDLLNETIEQFIDFRKKIKAPMTDRAVELMIKELVKLSPDIKIQIDIINQSIMNGWKGIFSLKQDIQKPQQKPKQAMNAFNQFPQRTYTQDQYADLEKKLINQSDRR